MGEAETAPGAGGETTTGRLQQEIGSPQTDPACPVRRGPNPARSQWKMPLPVPPRAGIAAKRAWVHFTDVQAKRTIAFAGCQQRTPFDIMEARLLRETLGQSLGSHDR